MVLPKNPRPEWSERIRRLIQDLKLTQKGLAERLGASPTMVSRWLRGTHEPTGETYVALGNLARRPEGIYFWERAGMETAQLSDANSHRALFSLRVGFEDFNLISTRKTSRQLKEGKNAVAIPLLNVTAYGDETTPRENVSLSQAEMEEVLVAPLNWCPHPENMIAIHFVGDSMFPVIAPSSIIFVDTAATDRAELDQRLVVVSHKDHGFKVARFERVAGRDLIVSANHKYRPVDVSGTSKWKIAGEVLWWISKDEKRPASRSRGNGV
ncbi:MAG TPA: S24 family peptidase [Terracidiphilus sp.]|nr:S24 family peptidase [Terracidiphilus sp.]